MLCTPARLSGLCDPQTLKCATSGAATVYYLLKTSSSELYYLRMLSNLGSWLQWTHGRLGLMIDDQLPANNEQLQCALPRSVFLKVHDPGFMAAHVHQLELNGSKRNIQSAYNVQRNKTRLAWSTFLHMRSEEWLCYFDDDVYVNVPALEAELAALDHRQKLMVANFIKHTTQNCTRGSASCLFYSQSGWCMTRPTAAALSTNHDAWKQTDDVGLGRWVAEHDIALTDSPAWLTENTKLIIHNRTQVAKISFREKGFYSAEGVKHLDHRLLANMSVISPALLNVRALTTMCGTQWAAKLNHDTTLMWHSYVESLRSLADQTCEAVILSTTLTKSETVKGGAE